MVKGFGMLPNKSLQGKGLCTYKDTACRGLALLFYSCRKIRKICRHDMCEIGKALYHRFTVCMKHCTFTAESPLNCVARPAGCRSDDGRDSIQFNQFTHTLLAFLQLLVPVFCGAFFHAAIAVPCVPPCSVPRSGGDHIIMPALDRGQTFHFADCFGCSPVRWGTGRKRPAA